MDFTTDKLRSLVRKWQTLIEAHVDVKTTDGYMLRMFCIGFTKKRPGQAKRTCYAQSSQIRQIRKKMVEIMMREASSCDLKELVGKFIPEAIGETSCPSLQHAISCCRVLHVRVRESGEGRLGAGCLPSWSIKPNPIALQSDSWMLSTITAALCTVVGFTHVLQMVKYGCNLKEPGVMNSNGYFKVTSEVKGSRFFFF